MFQRRVVHMIPEPAPVIPITEQVGQLVKCLFCASTDERPRFTQSVYGGALKGAENCELTVKVVELVQPLPDLDKVGHGVGSRSRVLVFQDFLKYYYFYKVKTNR